MISENGIYNGILASMGLTLDSTNDGSISQILAGTKFFTLSAIVCCKRQKKS